MAACAFLAAAAVLASLPGPAGSLLAWIAVVVLAGALATAALPHPLAPPAPARLHVPRRAWEDPAVRAYRARSAREGGR